MPLAQTIVEPLVSTKRSLGPVTGVSTSDTAILAEAFYSSPMEKPADDVNKMTDMSVKKDFQEKVMRNSVIESTGYWSFLVPFSRNFLGYGDMNPPTDDFEWKAPGDPTNSFVPNTLASPNADPTQAPPPGIEMKAYANDPARKGSAPYVGVGTLLSPAVASNDLTLRPVGWGVETPDDLLGNYFLGNSTPTKPT